MRHYGNYQVMRAIVGTVVLATCVGIGGSSARADFLFDPYGGSRPSDPSWPRTVSGFDYSVGNALALDGVAKFAAGAGGPDPTFQLYYQATLAGLINTGGTTIIPADLNRTFEITVVASVTQVVTSAAGAGVVTFSAADLQSPNSFFRMYYDPTVDSSNLNGTGFADGTLILSATPNGAGAGNFAIRPNGANPATAQLDNFLTNDYGTTRSVVGDGTTAFGTDVGFLNTSFFRSSFPMLPFNGSTITPFGSTDPARFLTNLVGGSPVLIPSQVGTINGLNGRNILFQMDANAAAAIPEPSSLMLAGLGLTGLLAWRRGKTS